MFDNLARESERGYHSSQCNVISMHMCRVVILSPGSLSNPLKLLLTKILKVCFHTEVHPYQEEC